MHVHVVSADGEAKFWIEPAIELAQNYGLPDKDITAAKALVQEREHDIHHAWKKHFKG